MKPTAITTTREANKGFYPTPPDLAEKLLAGIDWTMIETVLEPSAGKGDLVWANLLGAKYIDSAKNLFYPLSCPEAGEYIGFKKSRWENCRASDSDGRKKVLCYWEKMPG